MNDIVQLVIVCRDLVIDWKQFLNPIYIGVETGVLSLIKNNLPINFACGDFDSVSDGDFQLIENEAKKANFKIIKADAKKDYLDSELAIIEALASNLKFDQIVLITDGFRWDMILAQINLMRKYAKYQPILISKENYLFVLKEKTKFTFSFQQLKYHYVSLFSLDGKEVRYNFSGCKYYPEIDIRINDKDVLAISNEFDLTNNKNPMIEIKNGHCLVCLVEPKE
ncbi:MAG: thiamine diphosphokinase [Spiroplasma sp.]